MTAAIPKLPAPASRALPLLRGVLPLDRTKLSGDVVAGITLAALGIPEVMGYSKIAGTPVVTGLYTLLLPIIAFALFGGSRHLVVAADFGNGGNPRVDAGYGRCDRLAGIRRTYQPGCARRCLHAGARSNLQTRLPGGFPVA